ncbi:MAG: L1 protein [Lutjanus campechanus-associated papillomavirus 1]|uniref:Major capsid protein L1 n=1 Tax=Lutjanus campechanus-associated papillomavirus 1 TaxID=2683335 RepID=A0A8F5XQ69_9PAPI|nr:MAG: L1 protein [Lutjanus campechanus-associated papillomavirus 1]
MALEYTEGGVPTEPYVKSTDEFVEETSTTFIVKSDPIRIQGHPYHKPSSCNFVSPSRYNVTKIDLPDMKKMIMPPLPGRLSLQSKIPIWKIVGVRVDVQGIQSPAVTGFCQTDMVPTDGGVEDGVQPTTDTEGARSGAFYEATMQDGSQPDYPEDLDPAAGAAAGKNYRWGAEHGQRQLLAVGCKPLKGYTESWKTSLYERKVYDIGDGDLHEFGYGIAESETTADLTTLPIEMCRSAKVLLPDKLAMDNDLTGDSNFMLIERDATGIRHQAFNRNLDADYIAGTAPFKNVVVNPDPLNTKTAGMVASGGDIFNRSYWLNKAKGPNNGICWGNKLYITFVDNTRGFILRHSIKKAEATPYDPTKYEFYLRHVKEYQVTVIVRKCFVSLEAKLITYLLQWNRDWLKDIGFKFNETSDKPTTSVFRELDAPADNAEEEEEEVDDVPCVLIDCNGTAKMQDCVHSRHHMAVNFQEMFGGTGNAASKRAAPVKRKR